MEKDELFISLIEEIEKSCLAIRKRENMTEINRADKILVGIMNSKSTTFCFEMSFELLKKKYDIIVREYGSSLLHNTIRTSVSSSEYFNSNKQHIITLLDSITDYGSNIISEKLCKCLCLLIFSPNSPNTIDSPKVLLEILLKSAIDKKTNPDKICVIFFTALAQEYNDIFLPQTTVPNVNVKLTQLLKEVQIHCLKILNIDSNIYELKISALHCVEAWLQTMLQSHHIYFSLISKICDLILDVKLTSHAFAVIQSLISLYHLFNDDLLNSFGVLLIKLLTYAFPYISLVDVNQLNEVVCDNEMHRNAVTLFISFCNSHLITKIDNEALFKDDSFNDCLKIMYRVTAIGSSYSFPYFQDNEFMLYPYQFWNNFFDHRNVRRNIKLPQYHYLFTELYYILFQKITIYPWATQELHQIENMRQTRAEIACIFKKMVNIFPDLFVENLFITYKLSQQYAMQLPNKMYQLESATYVLGIVIDAIPINIKNLSMLKDIYSATPPLCDINPNFIKPFLTLLAKSAHLIINHLPLVFGLMIENIGFYIIKFKDITTPEAAQIIVSCVEFVSRSMDSINIQINHEISYKLIQLFGTLFSLILEKAKTGSNFHTFLTNKQTKMYVSMLRIVMRALSCMFLDGQPNAAENYVCELTKTICYLYESRSISMSHSPLTSLYKDIFLLLQMLMELTAGFLVDSNSGKGGLKLIFEFFFEKNTFPTSFHIFGNSEIALNYIITIINKCIYKRFGTHVTPSSLNNFVNNMLSLIWQNNWQLVSIISTYVSTIHAESVINTAPIDYIVMPVLTEGMNYMAMPYWEHTYLYFSFLVSCFKILPRDLMFYNYISVESAQIIILKCLECSSQQSCPQLSKISVKLLKWIIKCSSMDNNILLASKLPESNYTYLENICSYIIRRMIIDGSPSVILYHPILMEIHYQNADQFLKLFYSTLHSPDVLPPSLIDEDGINLLYWKYIDNLAEKDAAFNILHNFFATHSNKCKV